MLILHLHKKYKCIILGVEQQSMPNITTSGFVNLAYFPGKAGYLIDLPKNLWGLQCKIFFTSQMLSLSFVTQPTVSKHWRKTIYALRHTILEYWHRTEDVKGVTPLPCSGVLVVRERMRSSTKVIAAGSQHEGHLATKALHQFLFIQYGM